MEFERTSVESISETTDTADEVQANSTLEDISGNYGGKSVQLLR